MNFESPERFPIHLIRLEYFLNNHDLHSGEEIYYSIKHGGLYKKPELFPEKKWTQLKKKCLYVYHEKTAMGLDQWIEKYFS